MSWRNPVRWLLILLLPVFLMAMTIGAVAQFMHIRSSILTRDDRYDQFASRIAFAVIWRFRDFTERGVHLGRAIMAILHNETLPTWNGRSTVMGDTTISGGPSIGPMQVLYRTALDLGLIPADETPEEYGTRAADVNWCIDAGIAVFRAKLDARQGNIAEALEAYNGSGSRAEAYQARALAFLEQTFGTDAIGA